MSAGRLPKKIRELLEQLPGWSHDMTRGHAKLTHRASGVVVFTSKTPSDVRGHKNALAMCRRIELAHRKSSEGSTTNV